MKLGATNQIATQTVKPVAGQATEAAPAETSTVTVPSDSYKPEQRSYTEAIKTGLIGAAVIGIPAAYGAGKQALVGEANALISGVFIDPTIGAFAGGYAGYKLTPGKEAGGILLCALTVPAGAVVGAFGLPLLSSIGSAWGLKGAAVAAGVAGVVLGGAEAYFVHKDRAKHAA
jgi:hypothetical protein